VPTKKEKPSLSVTHPELAKEADGWDPASVTQGSSKKLRWKCKEGHSWESVVYSRSSRNFGCPICSNQQTLSGYNDLATTHPALAMEADDWDPTLVSAGSNKKFAWKCKLGHQWKAKLNNRSSKNAAGCPVCSNKIVVSGVNDLATTHPEVAMKADGWDPTTISYGSGKLLAWKCESGHRWTVSPQSQARNNGCPFCSNKKVEIGFNDLSTTHPVIAIQADGWDPREVMAGSDQKRKWKCEIGHTWFVSPEVRTYKNSGCPVCTNRRVLSGFNDLETRFPEIASQADGWDPKNVGAGSNKKMPWKCTLGHTWITSPEQRTGTAKSGCPICSNKKLLVGFNDLATRYPDLALEADGWDPTTIISGHSKKKWKCAKGHRWKSDVLSRTSRNIGCPSCAKYGFDPNKDGYLYFLVHEDWEMFQIGITNTPAHRLNDHKILGWEILEIRGPMEGHLTQQWETGILRMLKAKGADLANASIAGKYSGYSEAWSRSTFEAKSIKELMRLTEVFEES
jgi:ribosomal protein S27E